MSPPTNQSAQSSHSLDSPSTSKALQTSRKLKNLVEDDSNLSARKKIKIKIEPESDEFDTTDCGPAETDNLYHKNLEFDNTDSEDSSSRRSTDAFGWTRYEDKIILEAIQMGLAKNEFYRSLKLKLTQRSKEECEERYDFLINFLIKMKKED